MQKHLNLFFEAVSSVYRNRGRSLVVLLCLIGVLLPFVSAIAVSEGVRSQSMVSIEGGADLYVSRSQYGRNGPVALEQLSRFEEIPGVTKVMPRIVGRTYIGEELVVVVGIDSTDFFPPAESQKDQAVQAVLGRSLADRLELRVGSELRFSLFPPLPFEVTKIIDPDSSLWSGAMIIIPFHAAEQIFKLPGYASEILIYCRPGTEDQIAELLNSLGKPWEMVPPLRIQTKKIVRQFVNRGFDLQAGVFFMFYVTAFALSIPALLILSGFGRGARKREIGILKATGWQTLEVMELTCFENLILALGGSLSALLLAMVWLRLGNGIGIAPLFISGSSWIPDFPVPALFTPMPALFSFLFGLVLTMLGTIISTWKTAVTPPMTTMM